MSFTTKIFEKMEGVDISRIVPHLLKTNDLVLLSFPDGFIPIRIIRDEFFNYLYDPVAEGQILNVPESQSADGVSNLGFVTPERLKSKIIMAQPTNVFRLDKPSEMYQLFLGISPSYVRVFFAIPAERSQKNLQVVTWGTAYATVGFIDGFVSPLLHPAPESELIIIYELEPALGYANVLYEVVEPLLMFYVNRLKFGVITDPELVLEMVEKRGRGVDVKMKTVGGFTEFTYPYEKNFGIRPIPPGATRAEISSILRR